MNKLKLPLVMQHPDFGFCVPYSIIGVAKYYGITLSKKKAINICQCTKRYGSYHNVYSKALPSIGLKFKRIKFDFESVSKSIDKKIPVVLSYYIGENENHFSTIIGTYRKGRIPMVVLNDTYFGQIDLPFRLLTHLRQEASSWAAAIVKVENGK